MAQVLLGQMLRTATTSEPLGTTSGKLNVRASEIDSALTTLNAKDFATQTTLAALLAKVSGDQATQTTLAAVLAKLSADPATETSLAALKALFDAGTAGVALTGSLTRSTKADREGALADATIETLADVQQEAILHALSVFLDGESGQKIMLFDVWNGSTFEAHRIPISASVIASGLSPARIAAADSIFEQVGATNVIVLRRPLHLKGFRVRLQNASGGSINITAMVSWSEV